MAKINLLYRNEFFKVLILEAAVVVPRVKGDPLVRTFGYHIPRDNTIFSTRDKLNITAVEWFR